MTAEISIMNKHGIVLAADSAVTFSQSNGAQKAYNSANKLFTLGHKHSVGIMIYGNAEFMSVPWEIIIKEFRRTLSVNELNNLEEYATKFVEFIHTKEFLNNPDVSFSNIMSLLQRLLRNVLDNSEYLVNQNISHNHSITNEKLKDIFLKIINDMNDSLVGAQITFDYTKKEFESSYVEHIKKLIDHNIFIDEYIKDIYYPFFELSYMVIITRNNLSSQSGVVIAGYGREDIFPSHICFEFDFRNNDKVKFFERERKQISSFNSAWISPFAQEDMILTVLRGADPIYDSKLITMINDNIKLNVEEKNAFLKELSEFQNSNFINPIFQITSLLPIDELAVMADTLVNLTSFKRHFTNSVETVGGPIDVLVITKGDGPIWVKRKQYFDIKDNIDFKLRKAVMYDDNGDFEHGN